MIQHQIKTCQDLSWQDELKSLITDPADLLARLKIDDKWLPQARAANELFPLRVTPAFVSRMKIGDVNDPLLKQVLPLEEEFLIRPGYSDDPLEERQHNPIKGLVHKYQTRVLVISTTNCAINCRYCFRREFDYRNNRLSPPDWEAILDYIRARPEIDELILSGGEPLLQSDKHFAWLIQALHDIKHVERLRIHSRLPIVLPSRLTTTLIETLTSSRLHSVLVSHCNHINELDDQVLKALRRASEQKLTLLNQAVLLKGVNDNINAQVALNKKLFEVRVLPYYLHMLDRVNGTAHFEVGERAARELYREMQTRLPGYLLPKLVREEAGETSKTLIRI